MLQSRRALVALAVVLLLLAVGAGVASRPATSPRAADPPATEEVAAAEPELERTLRIGAARSQTLRVQVDRQARVTVKGADAADVVELAGLDLFAQISPDLPAVFDLLPARPGTYPIVLVGTGERVGALRVSG